MFAIQSPPNEDCRAEEVTQHFFMHTVCGTCVCVCVCKVFTVQWQAAQLCTRVRQFLTRRKRARSLPCKWRWSRNDLDIEVFEAKAQYGRSKSVPRCKPFWGIDSERKTVKPIELRSCMCLQSVNFMHVLASRAKHELKGKQCYYYDCNYYK